MREQFLLALPHVMIPFGSFDIAKSEYRDWCSSSEEVERPIDSLTTLTRTEPGVLVYHFFFSNPQAAAAFKIRWG